MVEVGHDSSSRDSYSGCGSSSSSRRGGCDTGTVTVIKANPYANRQ